MTIKRDSVGNLLRVGDKVVATRGSHTQVCRVADIGRTLVTVEWKTDKGVKVAKVRADSVKKIVINKRPDLPDIVASGEIAVGDKVVIHGDKQYEGYKGTLAAFYRKGLGAFVTLAVDGKGNRLKVCHQPGFDVQVLRKLTKKQPAS